MFFWFDHSLVRLSDVKWKTRVATIDQLISLYETDLIYLRKGLKVSQLYKGFSSWSLKVRIIALMMILCAM